MSKEHIKGKNRSNTKITSVTYTPQYCIHVYYIENIKNQ